MWRFLYLQGEDPDFQFLIDSYLPGDYPPKLYEVIPGAKSTEKLEKEYLYGIEDGLSPEQITALLIQGVNPNCVDSEGCNALFFATR